MEPALRENTLKEDALKKDKMKKRHPFRKMLLILAAVLLCAAVGAGVYFGRKGYSMYCDALARASIEERVEAVREGEGYTPYGELPEFYVNAVISVEDHRFRQHCGIDIIAVCRAAWTDLKAGAFVEGGSTITQQLAKNLLFTKEKKMERKAAEVFAALALEAAYSKDEILELYVNTVYFGSGYYGIYAAAMGYYGKPPSELTEYESAVLAGVPNAPSVYGADIEGESTSRRALQVLECMAKNGRLTESEVEEIQERGRE